MKKQIITNLGSNYLSKALALGLAFFIVPFLTRKLGRDVYGITVLAESTILFFGIVSNSMKIAMTRYSTYALSQGNKEAFVEYLSTGRLLLFACAALAVVLGGIVSYVYPCYIKLDPRLLTDTRILFFLITLGFAVSIPNIVFASAINSKQRPDLVNTAASGAVIFESILLVFVYTAFPLHSMLPYGIVYFLTNVCQNLITYYFYRRLLPGMRVRISHFDRSRSRDMLTFSIHSCLSRVSEVMYDNTALIIIGYVWGPGLVAVYSISLKFAMIMKRLFIEASWTLTPTFIDFAARRDRGRLERLYVMYSKIMSIVNTPVCIAFIILARPLIIFWVGPDFALAAKLLPIHMIPLFMSIPFAVAACITNAYARVRVPSIVSLITAAVNIVLTLVFSLGFSWGLYGIALAAAGSSLFFRAGFYPWYACRVAGISFMRYLNESFFKPFGLALLTIGAAFGILLNMHDPWWSLHADTVAVVTMSLAVYGLFSYLFILDDRERRNIEDVLKGFLSTLRRFTARKEMTAG